MAAGAVAAAGADADAEVEVEIEAEDEAEAEGATDERRVVGPAKADGSVGSAPAGRAL